MTKIDTDLWRWYHNVSECHYHIQITIKYRRAVLEQLVIETILETLKDYSLSLEAKLCSIEGARP